jgi:uncharacterized protein (TIGR00299 family) protein
VRLLLNPSCGVSGDMLLAALVDLGAPLAGIRDAIASTGLTGWHLATERADAGGIQATRAVVTVTDTSIERRAAELIELAARARPPAVAALATEALRTLAQVEADLHGQRLDEVHLHELGGHDTVIDIVGVAAALHLLDVDEVWSAPVAIGTGTVRTRHGVLPVPAPATAALLRGAQVRGTDIAGETVTPTGAALLTAVGARYELIPAVTVIRVGYGAGSRRLPDRPNVLQAMLCESADAGERMVVVETNVDDVTGEVLAHTIDALLAAGAADAWTTPAVMKKGRPAHVVHVLAAAEAAPGLEAVLLRESGSLGARRYTVERSALPRSTHTVQVDGHPVRIKQGPWSAKPEHDDVAAAARALGRTYRQVAQEAMDRYLACSSGPGSRDGRGASAGRRGASA